LPNLLHQKMTQRSLTVFVIGCAVLLVSCVPNRPPPPQLSQVQVRELQTREFPNEGVIEGMKAVSNALQDEGYNIENANIQLGLIIANRTINLPIPIGYNLITPVARRWKITANVNEVQKKLRVRISILEQDLSSGGGVVYSQMVTDQTMYQRIFSKIDKSVFLQKNKL